MVFIQVRHEFGKVIWGFWRHQLQAFRSTERNSTGIIEIFEFFTNVDTSVVSYITGP